MVLLLVQVAAGAEPGSTGVALATRLVTEVGPRPANTDAAVRAQDWVAHELAIRGWAPERLPGAAVWSCRSGAEPRVVLFLAHTDSVHARGPGANDNAAAVAVLLVAAEQLSTEPLPRRVCFAFPDAEEIGLRGSRALARDPEDRFGGPIDQVMALDLVGRGRLTHNGLGAPFGARRLRALLAAAPAEVPYVYRALSHGRPEMERSDHAWFTALGLPASHLMARAESGVDFAYHTAADTPDRLEPATLDAAIGAVLGVARAAPLPEEPGGPAIVVPWTRWVLPDWITWATIAVGGALGLGAWAGSPEGPRARGWVRWLGGSGASLAAVGLAIGLAAAGRPWDLARTDVVVAAAWGAWVGVRAFRPFDPPVRVSRQAAVISAWLLGAVALGLHVPLLAVPSAVAAGAVGLGLRVPERGRFVLALIAAWIPLYLVRADTVRELAHHHIVPTSTAAWTLVLFVTGLPLAALVVRPVRWLALPLVAWVAIAIGLAWWTPDAVPPYVRGPMLWPTR